MNNVKQLRTELTKNGLRYRLHKRTDYVAMYHVLATYSDRVNHIEVFRITIKKPTKYCPQYREYFPSNEDFGRLYDSRAFCGANKFEAENWFAQLVRKTEGNEVIKLKAQDSSSEGDSSVSKAS